MESRGGRGNWEGKNRERGVMRFPGFGRLRKEDTGYSWVPVTFMNLN
jgi:hypothetical protein